MSCACEGQIESVNKELATVKKLLWGNGDPDKGMVVRVQRNEDAIADLAAVVKDIRDAIKKGFWIVAGSLVSAVILTLLNLIVQHWKP